MDWKLGGLIADLKALSPGAKAAVISAIVLTGVTAAGLATLSAFLRPSEQSREVAATSRAPTGAPARQAQSSDNMLSQLACIAAQRAVLKSLKAPATADFPDCAFSAHEYTITTNPERTKFGVQGHVDSQNSYGANIRSRFVVLLDKGPGDGVAAFSTSEVAVE